MSYDPRKVIEIAKSEIGYLEKSKTAYLRNPKVLYDKTAGAGSDNYTKYGLEMHKIYPSVMDFPAAWCAGFVDWCFYKAYGVATAKSLLRGSFDDYTVAAAQMYKNYGALDHTPKVGDQIFFTKNGQVSGCYHTGLVIAVGDGVVTTIEGNTTRAKTVIANGGCVAELVRTVSNNTLFGHPNYGITAKNTTSTSAASTKTSDANGKYANKFDKLYAGTYKVVVSALFLREGGSVNYKELTLMHRGARVQCYGYYSDIDDVWLYVVYNGIKGFAKLRQAPGKKRYLERI